MKSQCAGLVLIQEEKCGLVAINSALHTISTRLDGSVMFLTSPTLSWPKLLSKPLNETLKSITFDFHGGFSFSTIKEL